MRKVTILMLLLCSSMYLTGANADLFDLDEEQFEMEFQHLSKLEEHVVSNSLSLAAVTENSPSVLEGIVFSNMESPMHSTDDFTFQWEGFLWGFLCCPVGCFVIAINKNKSRDQKLSFWIGVAASSVISLVYNLAASPFYYYY